MISRPRYNMFGLEIKQEKTPAFLEYRLCVMPKDQLLSQKKKNGRLGIRFPLISIWVRKSCVQFPKYASSQCLLSVPPLSAKVLLETKSELPWCCVYRHSQINVRRIVLLFIYSIKCLRKRKHQNWGSNGFPADLTPLFILSIRPDSENGSRIRQPVSKQTGYPA